MGCCDKKRAAMRGTTVSRPANPPARPLRPSAKPDEVRLRYLGHRGLRVRGAASGKVYALNGRTTGPLLVDARDVGALLRTGYFTR